MQTWKGGLWEVGLRLARGRNKKKEKKRLMPTLLPVFQCLPLALLTHSVIGDPLLGVCCF